MVKLAYCVGHQESERSPFCEMIPNRSKLLSRSFGDYISPELRSEQMKTVL
jgi:hypothetical protein